MSFHTPASSILLDRLLDCAQDGVFVIDRQRHFLLFNEALEEMTGYSRSDLGDKECLCYEVLRCIDDQGRRVSTVLCPAKSIFDGTRQHARQRLCVKRKDGSDLCVEVVYSAVQAESGETECVLGVMRDMAEAREKERELLDKIDALRRQTGSHPGREGTRGETRRDQVFPRGSIGARSGEQAESCAGEIPGGDSESQGDSALRLDPFLARHERAAILRALRAANGQRNKAARLMGISRSRLYRRMEALGIDPKEHM